MKLVRVTGAMKALINKGAEKAGSMSELGLRLRHSGDGMGKILSGKIGRIQAKTVEKIKKGIPAYLADASLPHHGRTRRSIGQLRRKNGTADSIARKPHVKSARRHHKANGQPSTNGHAKKLVFVIMDDDRQPEESREVWVLRNVQKNGMIDDMSKLLELASR